jgi:hypothetical protein
MPWNPFRPAATTGIDEELTTGSFLRLFAELADGCALRPEYDEESLRWMFDLLERKRNQGTLRKLAVRDGDDKVLGWYLYYAKAGGVSEVVQIGARPTAVGEVLDHCFYDAWRQGAIAVSGQMDPRFKRQLSAKDCLFRDSHNCMLVNTRDPELMQALCCGDAFLTRLEGEWWTIP